MNLEAVEQRCLNYLKQVSNPLVSLHVLLRHIQQDENLREVTARELLEFLRKHELFRVFDPLAPPGDARPPQELAEADFSADPLVILSTRVPTKPSLQNMMRQELATMIDALSKAIDTAHETGRPDMERQLRRALGRARSIQRKIDEMA